MFDWLHEAIFNPQTPTEKIFVMILAVLLFAAVVGLILFLVDLPKVPKWAVVVGFLGPVLLVLAWGLVRPALITIYQSFREYDRNGIDIGGAGFGNYTFFFHGQSNIQMLVNTLLWVLLVPVLSTVFGLLYAALVDRTRFEAAAKALIFLPTAISFVAASIAWKYVYYNPAPTGKPQVGLLNAVLGLVGLPPQNWLIHFPTGTLSLIAVMIWIQAGFAMTVLSAALKAVPDDIIEAARIDGASGIRLFMSVMVPSIRPTLVVVFSTVAITSLKAFDVVNVMGGNLPSNNVIANAFRQMQVNFANGKAGALAVLIFVAVTPVIVYNVIQMRKSEAIR